MFTPTEPVVKAVGSSTPLCLAYAVKGRKNITVQNQGSVSIRFGFTSNLTVSTGFQLPAGQMVSLNKTEHDPVEQNLYAIAESGSANVVVSEA